MVLDLVRELREQLPPEVRVGQLATAELDGHLDPVAVLQELDRPSDLRVEVALADLRLEADLLELDRPRTSASLPSRAWPARTCTGRSRAGASPGRRRRRNLDEVVAALLRQSKSVARGHDAELGSLLVDDPDLAGSRIIWLTRRSRLMARPLRTARRRTTRPSTACTTHARPTRRPRDYTMRRREPSIPADAPAVTTIAARRGLLGRGGPPSSSQPDRRGSWLAGARADRDASAPRPRGRRGPACTGPSAPAPAGSCSASGCRSRRPRRAGRARAGAPPARRPASTWRSAIGMTTAWTGAHQSGNAPAKCSVRTPMNRSREP